MRRLPIFVALSIFSLGVVHCVADDPSTGSVAGTDDGGNGGDSTTSGGDGSAGGDGSIGKTDGSTPPNDACIGNTNCPTAIDAAAKLKLWLRGNVGVTCTAGRVAKWVDQSTGGNDATPGVFGPPTFNTALAPQCGTSLIAGHGVVTFTAPAQDAGAGARFLDETLQVPMEWMMNTDYTVFVVHRRKVDAVFGLLSQAELGETACSLVPAGGYSQPQEAFALGFENLASTTTNALYYAQHCLLTATEFGPIGEADAGSFSAGSIEVDEIVYATGTGHHLYANGSLLLADTSNNAKRNLQPSTNTDAGLAGLVGRASEEAVDTRFQGDIAEVIGFAQALSDTERGEIEAYLKAQWGLTF